MYDHGDIQDFFSNFLDFVLTVNVEQLFFVVTRCDQL